MNLINLLVGLSLLSIILVGLSQFMTSFNRSLDTSRTTASRDQAFNEAMSLLQNSKAMKSSSQLSTNTSLFACTDPAGTNDCDHGIQKEFVLNNLSGISLAGTSSHPVRYSKDGIPCPAGSAASEACPMEGIAQFKAFCPSNAAQCSQAHSIEFSLILQQSPSITKLGGGVLKQLKKRTQSHTLTVTAINTEQTGGSGSVLEMGSAISTAGTDRNVNGVITHSISTPNGAYLIFNALAKERCNPSSTSLQAVYLEMSVDGIVCEEARNYGNIDAATLTATATCMLELSASPTPHILKAENVGGSCGGSYSDKFETKIKYTLFNK